MSLGILAPAGALGAHPVDIRLGDELVCAGRVVASRARVVVAHPQHVADLVDQDGSVVLLLKVGVELDPGARPSPSRVPTQARQVGEPDPVVRVDRDVEAEAGGVVPPKNGVFDRRAEPGLILRVGAIPPKRERVLILADDANQFLFFLPEVNILRGGEAAEKREQGKQSVGFDHGWQDSA